MDDLAALRLQLEWGVDESLVDRPVDLRAPPALLPALAPRPSAAAALRAVAPTAGGALAQARALAAAAATPDELRAALLAFDGCALRSTATKLVFRDGDPAARLVLVNDVPGAAEDRAGLPFAGAAAAFLDKMFASAGLDRRAWLATSLLPWRPPGDRKPADAEVAVCLPFLLRHLSLVQPRRVVLFGGLAARTLLAPAAGRRLRRGWHDLVVEGAAAVPVLALPAIGHIQAAAVAKRDVWAELIRLRRALDLDQGDHV